jgi:hypothetical protein
MAKTVGTVYKGELGLGVLIPNVLLMAGAVNIDSSGDPISVSAEGPVGVRVTRTGNGIYTFTIAAEAPQLVLSHVWISYADATSLHSVQIASEDFSGGVVTVKTGKVLANTGWVIGNLPEGARLCFQFLIRDFA